MKETRPNEADASPAAADGENLMRSLMQAAQGLSACVEAALEEVGLSSAKHGVLAHLARVEAPLPLSELAAEQRCVRSNMTQLIDRLEAEHLVRRVGDPQDRRVIRAALTDEGRRKADAGTAALARVRTAFAFRLSAEERVLLERVLGKL